eukprot:gb/GECH01007934.1/.p1 GENE.gb/GECH01007934.1/~~gb/GECH01007934.1/.p1  ORF type:complete len:369 (+),score=84.13 gb/GECH01007934.1/:1-1107(+)
MTVSSEPSFLSSSSETSPKLKKKPCLPPIKIPESKSPTTKYSHRLLQPTKSSLSKSFSNEEQDFLRDIFSGCSCVSLKDRVPDQIRPQFKELQRKQNIESLKKKRNRKMDSKRPSNDHQETPLSSRFSSNASPRSGHKRDLFCQFEYIPSDFSREKKQELQDVTQSNRKILQIGHGKPFCPTSGQQRSSSPYKPSYEYILDPFENYQEERSKLKKRADAKALGGPFYPSSKQKLKQVPTRRMLPEIVDMIFDRIHEDCHQNDPQIRISKTDTIRIFFKEYAYKRSKLHQYMNMFTKNDVIENDFKLSKVISHWNVIRGGKLLFELRPPWVPSPDAPLSSRGRRSASLSISPKRSKSVDPISHKANATL